ncbi:MAG: hydroxymethylbilane synthase [Pyrinomonadaceae bacterium]|nr:hydroxymethylbilane synthase [Pyrinomonadaceae bacterium]
MTRKFVIGTRGSDLALWQANTVKSALEANFPEVQFELEIIHTTGDKVLDVALSKIGDKGLFTRQIENELLDGSIDFAVHSLKDLQTAQPGGLKIGAVLPREVPNDIFIAKRHASLAELPQGARVATGSLRRRSQLLRYRPDLNIVEIRGNVPTRIKKFHESDLDAMILAYAGVHRLGLGEHITELISFDVMLPAVGQGVVAIETREGDEEVGGFMMKLDHAETRIRIAAERAFLRRLEGGCQVPIGALATVEGNEVRLEGFVGSLDGSRSFRESASGDAASADAVGTGLAERMIANGAAELLDETRSEAEVLAANKVVM